MPPSPQLDEGNQKKFTFDMKKTLPCYEDVFLRHQNHPSSFDECVVWILEISDNGTGKGCKTLMSKYDNEVDLHRQAK